MTKLVPFGFFVEVADGIEGLVHLSELGWSPEAGPMSSVAVEEAVRPGERLTVHVKDMDRERPGCRWPCGSRQSTADSPERLLLRPVQGVSSASRPYSAAMFLDDGQRL
ncbi:S1 RNA-binding domain-containing protein [Streptomyces griseorubiginosus]|uniref:S1 RNA-binding domain-containing protein n=1 Tax=Streptomyces griseorubiginosus TaxID=67304 RepID=UPI0033E75DA9